MRRHYLLRMLAVAVLHILAFATFALIGGRIERLALAVPANLLILVGVNLTGAAILFQPIQRYLQGTGSLTQATPRIQRLALLSAAWAFLLVASLMGIAFFGANVMCPHCDPHTMLPFYASLILLFASFIGIFVFFLIDDYGARLKSDIFRRTGEVIEPSGAHMRGKTVAAFIAVGVIPMTMVFLEVFVFPEARAQLGMTLAQGFAFDLIVTGTLAASAFYFIQRSLARPVEQLHAAMQRVAAGDLDAKVPILANDELGGLASGFNRMLAAMHERDFIRETFGRYVPAAVADAILQNRGEFLPEQRTATILYSDIEEFTALCERLEPPQVVKVLNEYFSLVVGIIERHGGVVNQFQGDAVLVTYNVPVRRAGHATAAVRTAIEIQQALAGHLFSTGEPIKSRIGINTGRVVAGPVGADQRLNYTVHGDAVNIAARLENLNKQHGTRILVSEATVEATDGAFAFREIGTLQIRGKSEAIRVFTPEMPAQQAPAMA
jgi:class 3 adenylate cyclase